MQSHTENHFNSSSLLKYITHHKLNLFHPYTILNLIQYVDSQYTGVDDNHPLALWVFYQFMSVILSLYSFIRLCLQTETKCIIHKAKDKSENSITYPMFLIYSIS